jgi:hypothetical protein
MDLIIDDEFKTLIPPLSTTNESQILEKSILNEGCKDPFVYNMTSSYIDIIFVKFV